MSIDRVSLVQQRLEAWLTSSEAAPTARLDPDAPLRPGTTLTAGQAVRLWEDQAMSRLLDVEARRLKATNRSFYTISSAGHEQNAVVGAQLRLTDPCFLHYRSGGLMMARSRKAPEVDPVMDTLLSLCARADDPISQGRHKVWGSRRLWVPPQTSTIASHLPKAVGMAFALGRARRLGHDPEGLPDDSIVCCTFGDASANHASALTGVNAARYALRRGNPMPVLFICEDNGLGISVETPPRWIRETFGGMRYLRYFEAEGEVDEVWDGVEEAIHLCRTRRLPVFLRLSTVRLWGHAGSDIELAYRSAAQIEATESLDPLLRNARRLVEAGATDGEELLGIYRRLESRIREAGEEAAARPALESVEAVVASLAPWDEARVREEAMNTVEVDRREAFWGNELPERVTNPVKRTLAAHLSAALADEMLRRPEILVFGEDVGKKGGVYYVTAGLQKRFGVGRVVDTLLDETTILGVAQGAALAGHLPVPEIQYLAYVHNAVDQLRGEAASLQFFSSDQFRNPMVIRMAGLAYQKGFGGHFHNDNAIGGLRDIPGLVLATPSRGDDGVRMLRGAMAMARACGRVVVFLEPIALYHEKDLHEEGDGRWLFDYPSPGEALLPGEVGRYPVEGVLEELGLEPAPADVLIVSYANGLRMSVQAQRILAAEHGVHADVLDLRWLNPLPFDAVARAARGKRAVLVVDECRRTGGGIAEAVLADLAERDTGAWLRSIRAVDTFVPLGPAANLVLVQTRDIVEGALALPPGMRGAPTDHGEGPKPPGAGDRGRKETRGRRGGRRR